MNHHSGNPVIARGKRHQAALRPATLDIIRLQCLIDRITTISFVPFPIEYFRHIFTVLFDIDLVIHQLVTQKLLRVGGA